MEQGADWSDAGASHVPRKCTVKTRPLSSLCGSRWVGSGNETTVALVINSKIN